MDESCRRILLQSGKMRAEEQNLGSIGEIRSVTKSFVKLENKNAKTCHEQILSLLNRNAEKHGSCLLESNH